MCADKALYEKLTYAAEIKTYLNELSKTKESVKITLSINHLQNKAVLLRTVN